MKVIIVKPNPIKYKTTKKTKKSKPNLPTTNWKLENETF